MNRLSAFDSTLIRIQHRIIPAQRRLSFGTYQPSHGYITPRNQHYDLKLISYLVNSRMPYVDDLVGHRGAAFCCPA